MILIIEILIAVILFEIVIALAIYIKNLYYNLFKGFYEKSADFWKEQFKDIEYKYNKLEERYKEKFNEEVFNTLKEK